MALLEKVYDCDFELEGGMALLEKVFKSSNIHACSVFKFY